VRWSGLAVDWTRRCPRHWWGTVVGQRPGFRSSFAPLDARRRGMGHNGRGCQGTAEVVGGVLVLVAAGGRGLVGMGGDLRGGAGGVCKIAGLRLPRFESWSCHPF